MDKPTSLQREAQLWVVLLDSQRATTQDAEEFKRWCQLSNEHATAFVQARQIWQAMRPAARQVLENETFALRASRLATQRAKSRVAPQWGRRAFLGGALAASASYLMLRPPLQLWPSLSDFTADFRTATGEQRTVNLTDGIVVQMNTQTRINVRSTQGIDLLAGEVEVDAQSLAQPFTVAVGDGELVTSGARFNVRFTGADVCVTCLDGELAVDRGSHRATLHAGRQLRFDSQRMGEQRLVEAASVTAWRQRRLVFNQTPLVEVVEEINRYREGKIILTNADLGRSRVQASISIDRLDDMISLIRNVYGVDVTELPGGIVLLSSAQA